MNVASEASKQLLESQTAQIGELQESLTVSENARARSDVLLLETQQAAESAEAKSDRLSASVDTLTTSLAHQRSQAAEKEATISAQHKAEVSGSIYLSTPENDKNRLDQ